MNGADEVRARADIVDVVGDHVELKKAGKTFKALCPFHSERTPSFVVFPDSGNWRCFGACATGGDVFDFVMRVENLDFRGALEHLARRYGVELAPPSPVAEARKERRDRLMVAVAAAAEFFQARLMRAPEGEAARAYLKGRGFTGDGARAFGLGWAPDSWDALVNALREREFSEADMVEAGLARERDGGGVYAYFRGRLVFPIRDRRGRAIGFGARTLDPEGVPKYLNSPKSDIFDKSRVLYGIDRAARAAREHERVVVVEGYTDVIRAHLSGFENVVASLGTALTEPQILALKRYAPEIVLALDADAAGEAATLRGLDVAQEAAAGNVVPVPTPRGLVRYEHRVDVDLRVATLPPGKDPDDVLRDDPDAWRALVDDARPVLEHLFDVLTRDLDLGDPQGKTVAADRLMPVVAAIPDPVARAAWVARLSDLIHIDERALAARLTSGGGRKRPRRAPEPAGFEEGGAGEEATRSAAPPRDRATWLLGHLLLDPRRLAELNEKLRALRQAPLSGQDFERSTERDLLTAVRYAASGAAPRDAPPEHRLADLPPSHADYAAALRGRAAGEPPLPVQGQASALSEGVLLLRLSTRRRRVAELQQVMADATPEEREGFGARIRELVAERHVLERLLAPGREPDFGKTDQATPAG